MTLPLRGTVNVTVDWGDGTSESYTTAGSRMHSYSSTGDYTIKISGTLTQFGDGYSQYPNVDKITSVTSFGNIGLQSLYGAFYRATSLTSLPATLPSTVTSLEYALCYATSFNGDISTWDVSNVITFANMFSNASSFNQDLNTWNTGKATDMRYMFQGASSFNGDITNWDVGSVETMNYMFGGAEDFNQDISGWNVSNVTNMSSMFSSATAFNQAIGSWNVGKVENMSSMFSDATSFNQDIDGWNLSSLAYASRMFYNATSFNQDLNSWVFPKLTSLYEMFRNTTVFNGNISSWDVSKVKDFRYMFNNAPAFNQDISGWDMSSAQEIERMFFSAKAFNQDLNSWNTSNVTNMLNLFNGATNFNGKVGNWDVSNVIDFRGIFSGTSFNQDISGWNVSNAENMGYMFSGASSFNQNLGSWNISKVTNMTGMFNSTALSTENYSNTLIGWSELTLQNGVTLDASGLTYNSDAADERQSIIDNYGWTINDGGLSMPVELTSFDGDYNGEDVELDWETATEVNNYGFEVERRYRVSSSEYGDWAKVGFVEGHGSVNTPYSYSFIDTLSLPFVDTVSYRLKQVDLDGAYEYSKVIEVVINNSSITGVEDEELPSEFALSQNYPNPFNPTTTIKYSIADNANVSIKVYNMLGQEVMTLVNEMKSPGTYNVKMDGSQLASGIYIYRMTAGDFSSVKKFVLMK